MSDFDERGRPKQTPQPPGQPTYPGNQGGTNWYSPSFSPRTGLFYVSAWEDYASIYGEPGRYKEGTKLHRRRSAAFGPVPGAPGLARAPINTWTEAAGHGAVIALDARTGQQQWKFDMTDVTDSGILTTGVESAVHGRTRRLLSGARRAHGRAAVEDESRRGHQQRSDHVPRGQQAVRRHGVGTLAVRVRARLTRRGLIAKTYRRERRGQRRPQRP